VSSLRPERNGTCRTLIRESRECHFAAADTLLQNYKTHLRKDRGLTENSVLVYAPFIRDFLASQTTQTGRVSPDLFDTLIVRDFILEHTVDRSREDARLLCTALRSFFRFLLLCGQTSRDLSNAVPLFRKYRQSVPAPPLTSKPARLRSFYVGLTYFTLQPSTNMAAEPFDVVFVESPTAQKRLILAPTLRFSFARLIQRALDEQAGRLGNRRRGIIWQSALHRRAFFEESHSEPPCQVLHARIPRLHRQVSGRIG
jgi:hypothetical protein